MQSKITLMGYEKHLNFENTSLFSDIVLPSGFDKNRLINTILLRSGEFELVYNDPYFLKEVITLWSKNWLRTFERWDEILTLEKAVNPLENYDRYEDITKDNTGTQGTQGSSSANDSTTSTSKVSAFNSSDFENDSTVTTSGNSSGSSNATRTDNLKETVTAHLHGNIGVTTSSQLTTEALEVARFNLYEQIADIFVKEFCILIY